MLNLPHSDQSDNFESDLGAVRTYLRQAGAALLEAADSVNPLVTGFGFALAERLGLVQKPALRTERVRELFSLQCPHCRKHIEILVAPPHRCAFCGTNLRIQWGLEANLLHDGKEES
jgi:hypothetical protein